VNEIEETRLDDADLPANWTKTSIGSVCLPVQKGNPKNFLKDTFRYIEVSGIDHENHRIKTTRSIKVEKAPSRAKQQVRSGDIVLSNVRVYLENIAQVPVDLDLQFASTAFTVLRPATGIDKRFLYYYVLSRPFINTLTKLQHGNSPPAVLEDDVRAQHFNLPPSRQQALISSKIEELFSAIEKGEAELKRIQSLLQRYRQSVLIAAVTGELTREWRGKNAGALDSGEDLLNRILKARRKAWEKTELEKMYTKGQKPKNDKWKAKYKEPKAPGTSNLPKLPDGWAWATFFQLGEFSRGKSKHRPRNDPKLYGGKYPFFQTGTVRNSNGRIKTYDNTYNDIGLAQSKLWPKGTVCLTIAANIAESGILEFDGCFPDSIVGLVPAEGVLGEYVEFFIRTVRNQLDAYAPATAQKNINLGILEEVAIPLPSTDEQKKIFSKVWTAISTVDSIQDEINGAFTQATAMRQSLLKAAFWGKLVPQDPTDEPASELLKRIAKERSETKQKKPKSRAGKKRSPCSAKK
jgi:type I restriction enzyme, S subunit